MPKKRSVGHRAYSRAKDNRSSLPGPLMIENNTVFSEGARAYSPFDAHQRMRRAILRNYLNSGRQSSLTAGILQV